MILVSKNSSGELNTGRLLLFFSRILLLPRKWVLGWWDIFRL